MAACKLRQRLSCLAYIAWSVATRSLLSNRGSARGLTWILEKLVARVVLRLLAAKFWMRGMLSSGALPWSLGRCRFFSTQCRLGLPQTQDFVAATYLSGLPRGRHTYSRAQYDSGEHSQPIVTHSCREITHLHVFQHFLNLVMS